MSAFIIFNWRFLARAIRERWFEEMDSQLFEFPQVQPPIARASVSSQWHHRPSQQNLIDRLPLRSFAYLNTPLQPYIKITKNCVLSCLCHSHTRRGAEDKEPERFSFMNLTEDNIYLNSLAHHTTALKPITHAIPVIFYCYDESFSACFITHLSDGCNVNFQLTWKAAHEIASLNLFTFWTLFAAAFFLCSR